MIRIVIVYVLCQEEIYTILERHVLAACMRKSPTMVKMNQFKIGRGRLRTSCTHEYIY